MTIKFLWNGIKVDGKLHRCFFSDTQLINHPAGTLTIYAKDYKPLPKIDGLDILNDSDGMTDYFETDRVRVLPGSTYHAAVASAIEASRAHYAKRAH